MLLLNPTMLKYICVIAIIIILTIIVIKFLPLLVCVIVVAEGGHEQDSRDEAHDAHERRHAEGDEELHLASHAAHKVRDGAEVVGALLLVLRVDEGDDELCCAHDGDDDARDDEGDRDALALAHGGDEADDADQDQHADHDGACRDPVGAVLLRGVDQLVDVVDGEQHHQGRDEDDEYARYLI